MKKVGVNMSRKKREKSVLGIYHVMLRGINKQDIFFNEDDFVHMMNILKTIPFLKEAKTGMVVSSNQCHIYAYCILHNHLHLLIREGNLPLSIIMKKIEVSYAAYYNKRYERIGHLFQGRYESEPVNDPNYFRVVLRYIALNPVKAMESPTAEAYPYSSWNEYVGDKSNVIRVIKPSSIEAVSAKFPLSELVEWIKEGNNDRCLDMDSFYTVKSDSEAWEILSEISGYNNPEEFRILDQQTQIYYLLIAIDHGVNISQAARLSSTTLYQIKKAHDKKVGIKSFSGSDPKKEKKLEQNGDLEVIQQNVRGIKGVGKKGYHQMHIIVEYLFKNPISKCSEIANHVGLCNEQARKHLVLLANENIVEISGSNKLRRYSLKKLE